MKASVAAFAVMVLATLIGVSIWATGHQNIAVAISDLIANPTAGNNPWMLATLFDAYFGFLWFWLWVAYKEAKLKAGAQLSLEFEPSVQARWLRVTADAACTATAQLKYE